MLVHGFASALRRAIAVVVTFTSVTVVTAADALGGGAAADGSGIALNWETCSAGLKQGSIWARFNTRIRTVLGGPESYFDASSIPAINALGSQTIHSASITTAVQGACNWQVNRFVYGLESDVSYERLAGTAGAGAMYPCCPPTGFTLSSMAHSSWLVTVRPRIGFVIMNWMPFVSGGVATGKLNGGFVFRDDNSAAFASGSVSKTALGFSFGTGLEVALDRNWSLEGEYLGIRLGNVAHASTNLTFISGRSPSNVFTQRVSLCARTFTLGANFRF
jgi:outer membrane immunogenic protein